MSEAEKQGLRDRAQRRRVPLTAFNSWTARPVSALLAGLGMSPNMVSFLCLVASLAGLALVASGELLIGALLVHLGLLLDHADGQVARRTGKGSDWGAYLDAVIDRIVEVGLIVASFLAAWQGHVGLRHSFLVFEPRLLALVAMASLSALLLWRFFNAYNDVLFLRATLRGGATPRPVAAAPGKGLVFNRDIVLAIWVVGTILGQHEGVLVLLLLLHGVAVVGKLRAFAKHHRDPAARAGNVLRDDYH